MKRRSFFLSPKSQMLRWVWWLYDVIVLASWYDLAFLSHDHDHESPIMQWHRHIHHALPPVLLSNQIWQRFYLLAPGSLSPSSSLPYRIGRRLKIKRDATNLEFAFFFCWHLSPTILKFCLIISWIFRKEKKRKRLGYRTLWYDSSFMYDCNLLSISSIKLKLPLAWKRECLHVQIDKHEEYSHLFFFSMHCRPWNEVNLFSEQKKGD